MEAILSILIDLLDVLGLSWAGLRESRRREQAKRSLATAEPELR